MKNIILILLLFFAFTFKGNAQEIKIPKEHTKIVQTFLTGVNEHSIAKVMKAMDKNYRKEQLKFLKGNKEQFVNELFGGEDLNTHKYVNQIFKKIQTFELYSIIIDKQGNYKYIFRSQDGQSDILITLYLSKKGKKYGFEGARG